RLWFEPLEDRWMPNATVYQWTGAGANQKWDNPSNWFDASGDSVNMYPGFAATDVAQFVDTVNGGSPTTTTPLVDGNFTISEIDFNSTANSFTISSSSPANSLTLSGAPGGA